MTALFAALFALCVFPGFLFMTAGGMVGEWVDRKLYARLQNRVGPPWFQPLADSVKLLFKEELIPEGADRPVFRAMPVLALAAAATTLLYVPLFTPRALASFEGDLVVVLYLLTLPRSRSSWADGRPPRSTPRSARCARSPSSSPTRRRS